MPLFEFRLESQDQFREDGTPHFRRGVCEFDTKEDARAELERREVERAVAYRADHRDNGGPDNLKRLEDREGQVGFDNLSGKERAALALHRQTQPYKLVKLEKVRGS